MQRTSSLQRLYRFLCVRLPEALKPGHIAGGAKGGAETGAHVLLLPTLQGTSPNAVSFSTPPRCSPRTNPEPPLPHFGEPKSTPACTRAVGMLGGLSSSPKKLRATAGSATSLIPPRPVLLSRYQPPDSTPARTHSSRENSQTCCRCASHGQQGPE